MWTVVFDAGPLITACRFAVEGRLIVDYIAQACYILIAPSVEEEVAVIEIRLAIVTYLRGGFPRCLCRALGPSPLHPPPHRFTLGRGDEEGILRRAALPPAAKSPQFPLPSPAGRERGGGQGER
jgi:hypothetical protein